MATGAFTFNIAKGRVNELAKLGGATDDLILILLQTTGLEADATLQDYATLSALLAASNDECTFTGYARRTLGSVVVAPDNTANTQSADAADPASWTNTGGAAQGSGAAIICYVPSSGAADTLIVPLVQIMAGTVTFDVGVPVNPSFHAAGFFTAS